MEQSAAGFVRAQGVPYSGWARRATGTLAVGEWALNEEQSEPIVRRAVEAKVTMSTPADRRIRLVLRLSVVVFRG